MVWEKKREWRKEQRRINDGLTNEGWWCLWTVCVKGRSGGMCFGVKRGSWRSLWWWWVLLVVGARAFFGILQPDWRKIRSTIQPSSLTPHPLTRSKLISQPSSPSPPLPQISMLLCLPVGVCACLQIGQLCSGNSGPEIFIVLNHVLKRCCRSAQESRSSLDSHNWH